MDQQVVIVTGASSGIGKVIATELNMQGYSVYGTSRSVQQSDKFRWLQLDVNDPDSIKRSVEYVLQTEGRLDVLINNAGLGMLSSLEEAPEANIRQVMDTNFGGVVRMIQAVLPQMRRQRSGKIINISSLAGGMGLPYRSIYSASKFAVEGLTESLRQEVMKFNIQVCSLQPGSIKTDIKSSRVSHLPGDSVYQPELGRTADIIDHEVGQGIPPGDVAKAVVRLIGKKKWRSRYVVAKPFQIGVTRIKPMLPHAPFERMMMNHYKISREISE